MTKGLVTSHGIDRSNGNDCLRKGNGHRRHSPSVPVPAIFYAHRCESPLKSTHQVGRFYHMTFQNGGHERGKWPGRSLGIKLKCQIAAIGVKNRPVCPHQSMSLL